MNPTEELTELLKALPDTYWDIVYCIPHTAERYGYTQQLIDRIKAKKDCTTSDVLDFDWEISQALGIPADNSGEGDTYDWD